LKILGIGNAIVDVICKVKDDFIFQNDLTKSTMKLVDEKEFKKLLSNLKNTKDLETRDLIGFVGAPWTLLVYMINKVSPKNGLSQDFFKDKILIKEILNLLDKFIKIHIENQIKAGATIIQIFDSWAGLIQNNFDKFLYNPTASLVNHVKNLGVPVICFPRGISDYVKFTKIVKPSMINIDYDVDPENLIKSDTEFLINPTGKFVIGGPQGDAGLTGRKIIVDTYGGWARHGGGAFSGKDPSKVDRSAAYFTRWVAKNIVAAGLAKSCELEVAYAIGHPYPTSIHVDTFGTQTVEEAKIVSAIQEVFDFKPAAIIDQLDLLNPIYKGSTHYGHFGKDDLPWECLSKVEALKQNV